MKHGVKLETLNWVEAERWFTTNPVIVMPLGAAAKEHGPHLPLNNDAIIADWLAEQLRQRRPVVIAPLINASFYPAFVEYPGSISLRLETARGRPGCHRSGSGDIPAHQIMRWVGDARGAIGPRA